MNYKDGAPFTFIGAKHEFDEADVVIIPAPYEGTVSYNSGTINGPDRIIAASWQIESFDSELKKDIRSQVKIHTMPALELKDLSAKNAAARVAGRKRWVEL